MSHELSPTHEAPKAATPDDFLKLDNQLCFVLYTASRAITRSYRHLLEPLGITYPQYLVLMVIWEQDKLGVKEIGEKLHLDSGTLTPLLKRMEQNGLVKRERSKRDERKVSIHLTRKGLDLKEKSRAIPPQMLCNTGMELEPLTLLWEQLKELTAKLESSLDGVDCVSDHKAEA